MSEILTLVRRAARYTHHNYHNYSSQATNCQSRARRPVRTRPVASAPHGDVKRGHTNKTDLSTTFSIPESSAAAFCPKFCRPQNGTGDTAQVTGIVRGTTGLQFLLTVITTPAPPCPVVATRTRLDLQPGDQLSKSVVG